MAKITKEVEVAVDASQAERALAKFGHTVESLEKEGLVPLNFAIGELEDQLYEMAAAGQAGTKEFQDMAAEVGKMKKVIIDTDLLVDGMSQNLAQNLAGATTGIASGFEFAQGAMASFGVESEALEETLLKVQSAMAMAQGLQGIKESISSFKGLGVAMARTAIGQKALTVAQVAGTAAMKVLNFVMNLNPVFLLITAFAALAGAIYLFAQKTETAAEANEKLNESYERTVGLMEKVIAINSKLRDIRLREMEASGATEQELHDQRINNLEEEGKELKSQLNLEKELIEKKTKLLKKAIEEEDEETQKAIEKEIRDSKAKFIELNMQLKESNISMTEENKRFEKEEEARRKEALDKWKAYQGNRLSALRQIQDMELSLIKDGLDKELEANKLAFDRSIEDTKTNENLTQKEKEQIISLYEKQREQTEAKIRQTYLDAEKAKLKEQADQLKAAQEEQAAQEEAFYEEYRQNALSQEQLEIDAVNDKYWTLIEMAKQYGLETKELEDKQAKELSDINDKYREEELAKHRALQDAKADLALQSLQAVADLVNAFAGDSEESQRRAFRIQKAVSIAQATIETYKGATAAFAATAASPITALNPAAPFIAAGAAIASGLANVATIARTQFEGGGGASGGGGGSSNVPTFQTASPSFNVVGNTGTNQLAESLGNKPMKAYVVSGDVTSAQSLDRNKIEQSTL